MSQSSDEHTVQLERQIAQLQHEKASLRIALDTVTEHADLIERQLERTMQALETKVADRTKELEEKNWLLQKEVSERGQIEVALIRAKERAEIANRAKTTFLANMSHELRTPLNAIIGYSDILLEDAQAANDDMLAEDLGNIRTAGEHLLRLISDLLDISRIESEQMVLEPEDFKITTLIQNSVMFIQPMLGDNQLHIDCPDDIGSMHADPTRLQQILQNLLNNATKFTHGGDIYLQAQRHEQSVSFRVSDTGIGIEAEQLENIFQAFNQADNSMTRRYGGMGTGLTLCKQLSQLMGAYIEVESSPGMGSTFILTFPEAFKAS